MDKLKDFAMKSFVEKITILQEIENQKSHEAIQELFEICKTRDSGDQTLFMAENTLRMLLLENEEQTVTGLNAGSDNIKKICIQVSGRQKYMSAAPVFIDLLKNNDLVKDEGTDNKNAQLFFEILSALSQIKCPESLLLFREYMRHPDPLISELSIETIGEFGDLSAVNELAEMINESETDERYETCDVTTASAIETIGKLRNNDALSFLASKIHHRNPTARLVIHQTLAEIGKETVQFIAPFFNENDVDIKIMAANVLGTIGGKEAGDTLVRAVDSGLATHPNIMFAIYEALGNIPTMKSLVCLVDGLNDTDDLMLLAVVQSLNNHVNSGVITKIKNIINSDSEQGKKLILSVVASKALNIFQSLYEDEAVTEDLLKRVSESNDKEILSAFVEHLQQMDGDRPMVDVKKLESLTTGPTGKRLLAVDDSKSMLLFYRSVASDMGMSIITAENGKDALDIIEKGVSFDLILTDMNMPVMDGIEMTRKVRTSPAMANIPIIMATTESEASQSMLAEKAGVNEFIKKPFTADILKDQINTSMV